MSWGYDNIPRSVSLTNYSDFKGKIAQEDSIKKKKYLVGDRYKIIIGKILKILDLILLIIKKLIKFILNANNLKIKKKNF